MLSTGKNVGMYYVRKTRPH